MKLLVILFSLNLVAVSAVGMTAKELIQTVKASDPCYESYQEGYADGYKSLYCALFGKEGAPECEEELSQ